VLPDWRRFPANGMRRYKRPVSVLVLIHTPGLKVLLLERAAHPGYWQSVTGSQEAGERLPETAIREVAEETGIAASVDELHDWQIDQQLRDFCRMAPPLRARGVTQYRARLRVTAASGKAGCYRSGRASELLLAAMARSGRKVLLVEQSRRDSHVAGAAGRGLSRRSRQAGQRQPALASGTRASGGSCMHQQDERPAAGPQTKLSPQLVHRL
jgi:hypothetical protein